jgi:hypothetical protein
MAIDVPIAMTESVMEKFGFFVFKFHLTPEILEKRVRSCIIQHTQLQNHTVPPFI